MPRTVVVCFLMKPRKLLLALVTELISEMPPFSLARSTESSPDFHSQNQVVAADSPTRVGMGPPVASGISVFLTGCCSMHDVQRNSGKIKRSFFVRPGIYALEWG